MTDITTDILIIGAGLAGAATSYHLSRMSDCRVVLVEKEVTAGEHSSGRNAALIREFGGDEAIQSMLSEGAAFLRTGQLAEYRKCGCMLLGDGDQDVSRRFPPARGLGRWYPEDGTVDVAGLLQKYLRGQDVRFKTTVVGWESEGTGLRVRTDGPAIRCRTLVNAAGPWAGELGGLALTPMKRHLFQTRPIESIDPDWPFVWDTRHGLYFRPESGGLLMSVCDETASSPGDYSEDPALLEELAEKLAEHQPGMPEVSILSSWCGHRVFAGDRRFVIGFDHRDRHVFHVAALGGHGVTSSYAVGKLAAEMLLGSMGPAAFAVERLEPR